MRRREQSRTVVAAARSIAIATLLVLATACSGSADSGGEAGGSTSSPPTTASERVVEPSPSPTPSEPRELQTVAVADQGALTNLPVHVAAAQGFLADEGLQLERVSIRGFGEVAAALINQDVDVAVHLPLMLSTVASGGTAVSYFANVQSPDMNFVASSDLDIPSGGPDWQEPLRATAGHTIGVPVVGGTFDRIPMMYMAEAGMDPENDVEFVATGAGQAALSALEIDQVQFIVADSLASVQAELRGVGRIVLTAGELPGGLNETIWVGAIALRDRLEAEPEFFSGFARAIERATAFLSDSANKDAIIAVIVEYHEVDEATATALVENLQSFQVTPELTPEMWQATTELWVEQGLGMEAPGPSYEEAVLQFE